MPATYNPWLVALSYLIAVIASFTALELASRVALAPPRQARHWIVGGAVAMGLGIWCMHFVGMLSLRLPIPIAYELPLTLLSLVPAVLSAALALMTVQRAGNDIGRLGVSAIFMGGGIAAMHYTGMAAIPMHPVIRYDPVLVAASVAIAIAASFGALWLAGKSRAARIGPVIFKRIGAALVMGFAIFGMHYTGMAAAEILPGSICLSTPLEIDPTRLAAMVGAGILTILALTSALSVFEAWIAAEKATVERLRDSENRYRSIVDASLDCIVAVDARGIIREFNPAAEQTFGFSREEILGKRLDGTLIPASFLAAHVAGWNAHLATGKARVFGRRIEVTALRKDGVEIPIELTLSRTELNGEPLFISHMRDLTAARRAQESLRLRSQAIEASANAVVIAGSAAQGRRIESVNPAFERITGFPAEEAVGRSWDFLYEQGLDQPEIVTLAEATAECRELRVLVRCRRKDGRPFWNDLFVAPVIGDGGLATHWIAIMSDATERVEQQRTLRHQASHDALTGLANRTLLKDRLQHAIALAARRRSLLEVVFIDLDHFKQVNDTLGHDGGDELLTAVARRIQGCVRESDTVARFGGDEFVVVLHADDSTATGISPTVRRITEALAAPIEVRGREVRISGSTGVSRYPRDGRDTESLLRRADAAMYYAKRRGRSNVQTFQTEMEATGNQRTELGWSLRSALAADEFHLEYQPQFDLRTGRITGVEALIRWRSAKHGQIGPAAFIPIAEETGLIVPIGEWVLRTACNQSRRWLDAGVAPLTMAVNLSARQLQSDTLEATLKEVLADTRIEPARLELELTESLFTDNTSEVAQILDRLKRIGVRLAIDDFGTGYSNLGYLRRFPLNRLKIDQSFVVNVTADRGDAAIATAIVVLGHSLGLEVVAEGVESEGQLIELRKMDCDVAQGYHFHPPEAGDSLQALLEAPPNPIAA